jgi:hypothetical protein
MADTKLALHQNQQPLKILLQKTSSGYNWEIHYNGKDLAEILPKIREANAALKKEYGRA